MQRGGHWDGSWQLLHTAAALRPAHTRAILQCCAALLHPFPQRSSARCVVLSGRADGPSGFVLQAVKCLPMTS